MQVNVDGTIKSLAASVAGRCGCNTHLENTINELFTDEFRKQQIVDLINQTYSLTVTINDLNRYNILQEFANFVGQLLINK